MTFFTRLTIVIAIVTFLNYQAKSQFIFGYDEQYHKQLLRDFAERVSADGILDKYQDSIAEHKKKTTEFLTIVTGIQQTFYSSLTTASSLISQGKSIPYLGQVAVQIYDYQAKLISEASLYPIYLPFAEKFEFQMIERTTDLVSYVGDIVTTSNESTILDRAKRDNIFHHIENELLIIRGLSYSAWQAVIIARRTGLAKKINPWQGYINQDKALFYQVKTSLKVPY